MEHTQSKTNRSASRPRSMLTIAVMSFIGLLSCSAAASTTTSVLAIGDQVAAGAFMGGLHAHPFAIELEKKAQENGVSLMVDRQGVTGELLLPHMVDRLKGLLLQKAGSGTDYDWVVIMGGFNDIMRGVLAEEVMQGLKTMFAAVLKTGSRLLVATVPHMMIGSPSTEVQLDNLNKLIINYANNHVEQGKRLFLLNLAEQMSSTVGKQQPQWWADPPYFTKEGSDHIGELVWGVLAPSHTDGNATE
ncbi:hypothetical protein QJQ45_017078 [Haematococcus lacustris]|nr:hypothetical protein QJQ45_017078 [Haematococcus lacustris]